MKIKKQIQNRIIKGMAQKQNAKTKLNAGQLREALAIFLKTLVEMSLEDKAEMINAMTEKK